MLLENVLFNNPYLSDKWLFLVIKLWTRKQLKFYFNKKPDGNDELHFKTTFIKLK